MAFLAFIPGHKFPLFFPLNSASTHATSHLYPRTWAFGFCSIEQIAIPSPWPRINIHAVHSSPAAAAIKCSTLGSIPIFHFFSPRVGKSGESRRRPWRWQCTILIYCTALGKTHTADCHPLSHPRSSLKDSGKTRRGAHVTLIYSILMRLRQQQQKQQHQRKPHQQQRHPLSALMCNKFLFYFHLPPMKPFPTGNTEWVRWQ